MKLENIADAATFLWLVAVMLQIGLSVSPDRVIASARQTGLVLRGFFINFLIVPLMGFGLLLLCNTQSIVATGFLIGVVFSGASLAPPLTQLAKGDVPFSIGLMILLAAASPIVSPMVLTFLLGHLSGGEDLKVNFLQILRVIVTGQIIPLALGLAGNRYLPSFAGKTVRLLRPFNNILVVIVLILVVICQIDAFRIFGLKAYGAMTAMFLLSIAAAWWTAGPDRSRKKAMTLNTTVRNVPAAMVIASGNFAGTAALAGVFIYSLFATAGTLLLAYLFGRIR